MRPSEDQDELKQTAAKQITFKAIRCFFMGLSYSSAGKWKEASALFERASNHTRLAISHCEACSIPQVYLKRDLKFFFFMN